MPVEGLEALLARSRQGDREAFQEAFAIVYDELRRVARWQRRRSAAGETLSTTALVHEAYLKLAGARGLELQDRHHLVAVAARAMRHLLVDAARARLTAKRGGGEAAIELAEELVGTAALAEELVALDLALGRLAERDERLARLVEWRYFGGMTDRELAEAMARDERTIRRDWEKARAILLRELGGSSPLAAPG